MQLIRLNALIAACVLIGCAPHAERIADRPLDPPSLTFIHLNDTYRIDAVEDGTRGGFARVATVVRKLKQQGFDVRITHAGDFLYPSLESQLWDGEQMIEALNYLDRLASMVVVPGNHEFDPRNPDPVVAAVRQSEFDWTGDNLRLATGQRDVDEKLQSAFTFKSGNNTIGIFSLTLDAEDGGNLRDYAPVDGNYVVQARRAIAELEQRGVDLIVGLTHLDLDADREIARLRSAHPKFMFILGGHEHEPEFEAGSADRAAIFKGASNARVIWQVDVTFDDDGNVVVVDASDLVIDERIEADAGYEEISDKWRQRLLEKMPFLTSRLGDAALRLDGREVAVRNGESNWGNFIADQMPGAFGKPGAQLAFVNGGTLRLDDYVADDITYEDIGRTFGFSSYLRRMTMSGTDFKILLEAGYRGAGTSKGYFPQVSGFRVCVDRSRPEGERIVALDVRDGTSWSALQTDRDYLVVAPDFLYEGGDGYDFSAARDVSPPGAELKYLVFDAVISAQAEGRKVGAEVDPDDPRIVILGKGRNRCFD